MCEEHPEALLPVHFVASASSETVGLNRNVIVIVMQRTKGALVRVIVAQLHNIDEAFDFGSQLLRSILDSRAPVADLIRRGVRHIQCRDRLAHHIRT